MPLSTSTQLTIVIILGLTVGSFGNVLLYRMPQEKSINGRSKCRKCKKIIRWFDLIPLISFVLLLGKCRHCKSKISWRYPFFEALTATVFLMIFLTYGTENFLSLVLLEIACYSLLLIAFYDAATQKIPDIFSVVLILSAIFFQLTKAGTYLLWQDVIFGAAIPLLFFGSMWLVSRGRWIGSGDIILGTAIGLLLGVKLTLISLFFAYTLGAAVALWLILSGRAGRGSAIAFGPFLCVGAVLALLVGTRL